MKLIIFIILLGSCLSLSAQSPKKVLQWMNTVKADNVNFYTEIPFEYKNGHIVIKVTIGEQEYDYIFDTGGYNDITDAIQQKNNFPVLTTQTVGSTNKIRSVVNIVKVDSLKIGPIVFRDIAALQMNFDNVPSFKCGIDGALIGASIIKNYAWQIDYPSKKIIVTDDATRLLSLKDAVKMPVTFNTRLMPFINIMIEGRQEKVMFDLGSSTDFSLTEKTAIKYISGKKIIRIKGLGTEGGNGVLRQDVNVVKADSISIGANMYYNRAVIFTSLFNENLVGNPIIKNFIVTLDFQHDALYLLPIKESPPLQGWSSFGFKAEYKDNKILITSVYESLAASKAGVTENDELVAINDVRLSCTDYCSCLLQLEQLQNNQGNLRLTLKRNDKELVVNIAREKVF